MIEDDEEQMKEELKEAFRIYDKEVETKQKQRGKTIAYDCSLPSVYKKYKRFDLFPWNLLPQGQGFITNDVLKDILREIDNTLTEDDLDHIIEEVDEDGSGTMDFDEFQEMMMG